MLTIINKQDETINVPFDSISIDSVAGDPLGKAKFKVIDSSATIPLKVLQEVIFVDENVVQSRITSYSPATVSPPYSDNFLTNTSANYTSTFNKTGGTVATWTWSAH